MKCKPSPLAFYQSTSYPSNSATWRTRKTFRKLPNSFGCWWGGCLPLWSRRKRGGGGGGGTIGLRNGSCTVLITVPHTCSPYGAVLLIAFLPQPHSARPAPNICPCLKFLDNCLSCLLMQLKTWIYGSCHVACRKGSKGLAVPLL